MKIMHPAHGSLGTQSNFAHTPDKDSEHLYARIPNRLRPKVALVLKSGAASSGIRTGVLDLVLGTR